MSEFTERKRRALLALQQNAVVRYGDLPIYVGRGTMAELVTMGLAETVNKEAGEYSKYFGWRLLSKTLSHICA
jgi:hypothetical protein